MKVDNKEQKSYDHKKFMKPRGARLCVFYMSDSYY